MGGAGVVASCCVCLTPVPSAASVRRVGRLSARPRPATAAAVSSRRRPCVRAAVSADRSTAQQPIRGDGDARRGDENEDDVDDVFPGESCNYPREAAGTRMFDFRRLPEVRREAALASKKPVSLAEFTEAGAQKPNSRRRASPKPVLAVAEQWFGRVSMVVFPLMLYAYWGSIAVGSMAQMVTKMLDNNS
eukprot:jgi/Chlat1/1319/Chrsp118S01747